MKERKPFLLRMDPVLHEALEAWAQQEMRSLNGQIEYLLKQAVQKRKRSEAPTDVPGRCNGRLDGASQGLTGYSAATLPPSDRRLQG